MKIGTSPLNPTGPVTRTPGTELIRNRFAKCRPDRPGGGWTHGGLHVDAGDYDEIPLYSHVFLSLPFAYTTQRQATDFGTRLARSIAVVLIVKDDITGILPGVELLARIFVTTLGFTAYFVRMDGALVRAEEHC